MSATAPASSRSAIAQLAAGLRRTLRRRDKPSILGPNYLHLSTLARALETFLRDQRGVVLDLGADEAPYRSFVKGQSRYIRLDLDPSCRPDIAADIISMPIRPESVDVVICTQVVEFVPDPRMLVAECRRVLKPGGTLILSAPFFWPNQPTPFDTYRFTLASMRRLFESFSNVEIRPNGNRWATLAQMTARCVYIGAGVAGIPIYLVCNVVGRVLDRLPADDSLTTGYTVRAVKPRVAPNES